MERFFTLKRAPLRRGQSRGHPSQPDLDFRSASSPSCPARHTTAAQHQRCQQHQQHQQHQRQHASKQRKHSNAPQPARNASVAPMAHTHQSPCSLNAKPASEAIGSNCTSESRASICSSPVSQPSSLTRELSMPACYSCQRPARAYPFVALWVMTVGSIDSLPAQLIGAWHSRKLHLGFTGNARRASEAFTCLCCSTQPVASGPTCISNS